MIYVCNPHRIQIRRLVEDRVDEKLKAVIVALISSGIIFTERERVDHASKREKRRIKTRRFDNHERITHAGERAESRSSYARKSSWLLWIGWHSRAPWTSNDDFWRCRVQSACNSTITQKKKIEWMTIRKNYSFVMNWSAIEKKCKVY